MRKALLLLLPLIACAALLQTWQIVAGARVALSDSTDAGLARAAGDFLTVVTPPGSVGEFDAARLLSGAHTLSAMSFWPGGLQVVVGNTPLLPDSIGLLPLPESVLRVMDDSPPVVTIDLVPIRVQLVPLRPRLGGTSGAWVASWGSVAAMGAGLMTRIGYIGAAGGIMLLSVLSLMRSHASWRWGTLTATVIMIVLLRSAIGSEWEAQLRQSTELKLRTVRHLVEVAATAPGVRQVTVGSVAASAEVKPFALMPPAQSDLAWSQDSIGAVAEILAATPRTLSGLKISLHLPERPERLTGRVMPWLLIALAVALIELLLSGLSRRPAIFHMEADPPPVLPSAGNA